MLNVYICSLLITRSTQQRDWDLVKFTEIGQTQSKIINIHSSSSARQCFLFSYLSLRSKVSLSRVPDEVMSPLNMRSYSLRQHLVQMQRIQSKMDCPMQLRRCIPYRTTTSQPMNVSNPSQTYSLHMSSITNALHFFINREEGNTTSYIYILTV